MTHRADYEIAVANFKEFAAAHYPKLLEDDAFERFAADLVLRKFRLDSDVEEGIVAGGDDGGIDGFYILLGGNELIQTDSIRLSSRKTSLGGLSQGVTLEIVIVQAKRSASWDSNVFGKIQSTLTAVLDSGVSEAELRAFPLNGDVVEKALILRKLRAKLATLIPKIRITVAYVSLANPSSLSPYMQTKKKQLAKFLRDKLPTNTEVDVEYFGDSGIVKLLSVTADFNATLKFAKVPVREGKEALVGLVRIKDYVKFLRHPATSAIREEMFAANVRDFAGTSIRVNDAISRTLRHDSPSSFWWVNNGITIIADTIDDPFETEWVLTNPLIVNGLQTSYVVHSQADSKAITKRRLDESLLVRVIKQSDPEVRESIITGTNNQTAISSIQLSANDQIQQRIEVYLRAHGWFYERRRYQYRGQAVPAARKKNIAELAQAVMAVRLLEPDTARARPTSLLGTATGYTRVFDPGAPEVLYLKALNIVDAVDAYLRTPAAKSVSDEATNSRFYLASGWALRSSKVRSLRRFSTFDSSMLRDNPTTDDLKDLHKLLVAEAAKLDDGKLARDRIFKGSKLKPAYLSAVLAVK